MVTYADPQTALEIESCPECYGLWFDGEELKLFFASSDLSQRILQDEAQQADLNTPNAKEKQDEVTRLCPACRTDLFASHLGDTQVDYCLACRGIWLDRQELDQLVSAYLAGERGNLLIVNQLIEGLGTSSRPNPRARDFLEALERYRQSGNQRLASE